MTVPGHDGGHAPSSEPADAPPTEVAPSADSALDSLRAAVGALPWDEQEEPFDAADQATRFEAVHDALVAVLADVDRT
ncbi:hypothetical protein ACR9E3_32340 [Actinomycetospora sp. C-140]